jgi:hypothetical protein
MSDKAAWRMAEKSVVRSRDIDQIPKIAKNHKVHDLMFHTPVPKQNLVEGYF